MSDNVKGGGMGSNCLAGNQQQVRRSPQPPMFHDGAATEFCNPHEASARRGQARMTDGARSGRRNGGNPGSQDAGGY
jgi:hypothetical protein